MTHLPLSENEDIWIIYRDVAFYMPTPLKDVPQSLVQHNISCHALIICRNYTDALKDAGVCMFSLDFFSFFSHRTVCRQQPRGPSEGTGMGMWLQEGSRVCQEVQVGSCGMINHKACYAEALEWAVVHHLTTQNRNHTRLAVKFQDGHSKVANYSLSVCYCYKTA